MSFDEPQPATVEAPATVGNFGPGFDAFALALHGCGDTITLTPSDDGSDAITVSGPGADDVPTDWRLNVAGVAIDALRGATGSDAAVHVHIQKGQPGGSGLGSSASSAGGAALAFHAAHPGADLQPEDLVRAAADGESVASGRHYDDVSAVVMGGLAIVRIQDDVLRVARVPPPRDLHLAVVAPTIRLSTKRMREVLPAQVALADAASNIGNAAALVDAFHRGDVAAVGSCMDDRLATPARAPHVPFFEDVRKAALVEGALGVTLSGSGPAVVAVCDREATAREAASAMADAVRDRGVEADHFAARPETEVMHRAVAMR